MNDLVLDTHALLWYLASSTELSPVAQERIDAAVAGGGFLRVSTTSIAEILYLEEKKRVPAGTLGRTLVEVRRADGDFSEVDFTSEFAEAMARIPRDAVPDMPDRMIAATALHLGLPLVTADRRIRSTNLPTVW